MYIQQRHSYICIKCLKCTRNKGLFSPIHQKIVYYSGLSDVCVFFFFNLGFNDTVNIRGFVRAQHNLHFDALQSSLVLDFAIVSSLS